MGKQNAFLLEKVNEATMYRALQIFEKRIEERKQHAAGTKSRRCRNSRGGSYSVERRGSLFGLAFVFV